MSDLTPHTQDFEFDRNISPEEKKEILESIDKMVMDTKLSAKREAPILKTTKRDVTFPLALNLLAVLAVVASFAFTNYLSQRRRDNITEETQLYLSAEGKLLEEVKKKSQEKIQAKDEEISQIQTELEKLRQENNDLESNMETAIGEKEEALRKEMEEALEAERKDLAAAGKTEEEIQARLREVERELEVKHTEIIDEFRRESEVALANQRRELEQTITKNRSLLTQANEEKLKIQEENQREQERLRTEFEEEKAALSAQNQEARSQLEALSQAQEEKRLLLDQINGTYQSIMSRVNRQQYPQALEEIKGLRTLLASEAVRGFPEFVESQTTDLFLLETLEDNIQNQIDTIAAEAIVLDEPDSPLVAVEDLAQRGLDSLVAGNTKVAERLFEEALGEIPLLAEGIRRLEDNVRTRRAEAVTAALTEGEAQLERGQWEEAAERFRTAANRAGEANPELTADSLRGLVSVYTTQLDAEGATKDTQLEERTAELSRLNSQLAERDRTIANLRRDLEEAQEVTPSTEMEGLTLSSRSLGTVSRVVGNRITIATPGDWDLKKGTDILVHRRVRSREPSLLANGKITSITIEAEVEGGLSAFDILANDIVSIVGE